MTNESDAEQGTHFFHVSFIFNTPNGFGTRSRIGVYTPGPRSTRLTAYEAIVESLRQEEPELRDSTVLSFDLQPNEL